MNEEQKAKAVLMALGGKTIAQISKELGAGWGEVSAHVRSEGALSWQGAKMSITNRLTQLKNERSKAKREILVDEANELVNYIYYSGKELRDKIDRAHNALERVNSELSY